MDLGRYASGTGHLTLDNQGTITGFVELAGGGRNSVDNQAGGVFELRHFADTDGDGVRDTKRVAVSDFGSADSQFTNQSGATLRLAQVAGARQVDASGFYTPTTGADDRALPADVYDLNRDGIVQGQLVNLGEFRHAGELDLRGPQIGNTLVITGAASASGGPGNGVFISDGGTLRLASGLSATGAAATTERFSDMLIVDATRVGAGGATRILVDYDPANLGHLTEGNGIELVEVRDSSASAAGAFALGNRVASGAYEYALYHGGVAGDAEDGNWYLRSFLNVEPEESGQPVIELPNYRQEVPVDMAVPALAHRLGLAVLGTYHDRAGEDYMLSVPGNVLQGYQPPEEDEHRLWARAFTSSGKAGDSSSLQSRHREFQKDGPRYDYDLDGIQLGLDLHRSLDEDGARNIAGAYFAASRMKADIDAIQGGQGGKVSMDGYSLGAYWTHLAPSRWYLDAVGQLTRYDNVRAKASGGETVKPDGWGFAASLEGGYPFQLDEKWSLEPQAQLVYQYVDLGGSTHDRYGRIDFKDSDALYGRLGARLARNWEKEDGREHAFWLRANLWHDFGAEADTTFSAPDGQNAVKLHTGLGGTWGQVGAGFNTQFRDNLNAFLAVDYEQSLENSRAHGVSGRIGLQYTW